MKNVYMLFMSLLVFILSCNNSETATSKADADTPGTVSTASDRVAELAGCYLMIQGKDTATLDLAVAGTKVSGKLQYRRFEKDRNAGTISGTLRDTLIQAYYTFTSEGMTSVREVVFSVNDSALMEGYGEIIVKGDTAKFVDLAHLMFLPTPFVKIDCENQ